MHSSRTKAALLCCAAVCALALSTGDTRQAQTASEPPNPLQAKADAALKALLSGSDQDLFNALAPWIRGRMELNHEIWHDRTAEQLKKADKDKKAALEKEMLKSIHEHDPGDRYKVRTLEDVLALKSHQMFALAVGHGKLQGDSKLNSRVAARWHLVDRKVYHSDKRAEAGTKESRIRSYAEVQFANKHEDSVTVHCAAESETAWFVESIEGKVGPLKLSVTMQNPVGMTAAMRDAQRAEGEQMLNSMKNQARVYYAKTGENPLTFTGGMNDNGCAVDAAELEGVYCRVRDKLWYKKRSDSTVALVCEGTEGNEDLGYGLLIYNVSGGSGTIEWYETEAELDAALKEFTG